MTQAIIVVDAFTARPFAGNPAAVCVLPGPADEGWMRAVAREMNLSETAFLHAEQDGYRLRWLTPTVEAKLCGHATLASAHVLWATGRAAPGAELRFYTLSGRLTARQAPGEPGVAGAAPSGGQGNDGWIVLDFPARPTTAVAPPPGLVEALGARPLAVERNELDYLVQLESEAVVRGLAPDLRAIAALPVRGVMVTATADAAPYDFVSRFFGPAVGVPEDPVTGSAHCALGPFWGQRLGKGELLAYQASARGGTVRVSLRGERVELAGQAVIVTRGEILGPDADAPPSM